jgi:hypothetical protein
MNNNLVTIVALSVDTRHAVLYFQDGSTHMIPQGDARLPRIVADSRIALQAGIPVQVNITPIFVQRTEFADAEQGTKGVVKFFRVAKSFLKKLVNTESPEAVPEEVAHVSPLTIGVFPGKEATNQGTKEEDDKPSMFTEPGDYREGNAPTPTVPDAAKDQAAWEKFVDTTHMNATTDQSPVAQTNDQKLDAARERMQQLVGNSVGTSQPEFHTPLKDDETIVAVHEKSGAIIPDAHKLARQLRSAQKLQDYAGFEKFIERLAAIIDQRGHSVEDLMKFIEQGDLPIADDGSIVIYKKLNRGMGPERSKGEFFVDVHTGKIRQKVGSYVYLLPHLVDPNRRNSCSNGLHVGVMSYVRSFSGNVTIMAKLRPEDVFAVPEQEHTKMRVAGYHIVAELPAKLRQLVDQGVSISADPEGAVLLNNVLRGNHIGITQHVQVGGHQGTDVTYTDVEGATGPQVEATSLGHAEALDMQEALEAKAPVAPEIKATDLVQPPTTAADWDLGKVDDWIKRDERLIIRITSNTPKDTSWNGVVPALVEGPKAEVKLSQKEKANQLYEQLLGAGTFPEEQTAAKALLEFKKSARKSWSALGLPEATGDDISKMLAAEVVQAPSTRVAAAPRVDDKDLKKILKALKEGKSNVEVASMFGLSKDQVYRLKKKHQI